jgi:type III secretory pathway component EscT
VGALFELIFGSLPPHTPGVLWLLAARLLPLCLLAPFFVGHVAPLLGLVSVAALTLGLLPAALASTPPPPLPQSVAALAPALFSELLVGLAFAFTLSLPFWALGWAGTLWSHWGGIAPEPTAESGSGPLAELARLLGVLAFFAAGGAAALLHGLGDGLIALPLGTTPALFREPALLLGVARSVALALSLALSVALPLALAIWLLEAALGALQRGFAGLPVAGLAVPLRALCMLAGVLLSSALLLSRLPPVFREALAVAQRLWS